MKLELTLASDEYAALSKAPGRSAQQRLRWLVKFWGAVCEEQEKREPKPSKPTLYGVETSGESFAQPVVLDNSNIVTIDEYATPSERLQSVSMNDGYGTKEET